MSGISLCGQLSSNTGQIGCDVQREAPQVILIGGAVFAPSDYADETTFAAAVLAKIKLSSSDSSKLYPLPVIQGTTDKTEAAKFGSLGYGLQFKMVDSRPGYEFDIMCGTSLEKKLKAYDGKQVPMFIYDKGQAFWGVSDVNANLSGAVWMLSLEPRPFQDGQNPKVSKVTISLVNTDDWVVNAGAVVAGMNTASLKGLNDLVIKKVSNAGNIYEYKVYIPSAALNKEVNAAVVFGADLASASLWKAKTGATFGTSLTITSVAVNTAGDGYTVTYDTTAYAALSTGAKIKQDLDTPTALDAADVTGVEAIPVIVTK